MSSPPSRPERPVLPPALWALVATLGVCRALLAAAPPPALVAACSLVAGCGIAAGCATLGRTRLRGLVAVLVAIGAAATCAALSCALELRRQGELCALLGQSPVSSHVVVVESDLAPGRSGWRGRARLATGGSAFWLLSDVPLSMGERLSCVGRFSPNDDGAWGAASRAQGLAGTVRVVRVLERSPGAGPRGLVLALRERVLESLDADSSDARALVAGSVCGHTGAMAGRGLEELFSRCGVSHLVAVSGGHLVLVNALAGMALGRTRLRLPARSALLVLVTGLFVTFCGAPLSAVRSWAMSASAELSRLVGRRAHPLSSASFVSLVMALVDPGVTGQLGYLLSVVCVCGICALGPYASYVLRVLLAGRRARGPHGRLGRLARRAGADAREALALTLVSQAVTAPLTCSTFGTLSLVAPLANVLLAPLFSVLLALGLASALLVWAPSAQGLCLGACEVVSLPLMATLRLLSGLPCACVAVSVEEGAALAALAGALAALLAAWPRVSRRALLALGGALLAAGLCWYLRWRCFAPACIRVLDVGQGDAILVTDGPGAVLVDTGPGDAVVGALARSNVTHLDAVVLTHLHADHAGGLDALLGVVDVDLLVLPEGTDASGLAEGVAREEVGYGDVLRVGGFSMRVVSPLEPTDGEGNEGSLELLVTYARGGRELTALLAADAESEETGAAVERGDVGDVDLLKVGHHGSRASLTPEIAAALAPEVSVASAGEGNGYGHPDPRCEETLEAAGSSFLCTIDVGDVCVEPGSSGPVVSCQREEAP